MCSCATTPVRNLAHAALSLAVALSTVSLATRSAEAQFFNRAVGGISIDANGMLTVAEIDNVRGLHDLRQRALAQVAGDLNQPTELRKVSLRGLAEQIRDCQQANRELPDEVKYLAGLQRIRYVFVYPDRNDIVLAGYGEGWKVNDAGTIVGSTTGRPVLLLEDLLVALRTADEAARGGITCSIDPTPEGLRQYQSAMRNVKTIGPDPGATILGIEQALGPQTITVTGVPATSHFARVLVAADYRMKRLAQNFEPAPIAGLPSYLSMMGTSGRNANAMQRWWLATNYQPLLTDAEGLAWELRGQGVKAMTEEDFMNADGSRRHSGKANPLAKKWADNMTAKYDELSAHDTIFGELRNCMDLAVVSALIAKENLARKANCQLSELTSNPGPAFDEYPAPKQVDSKASVIRKQGNWIISTSGGVQIHSWGVADRKEQSDSLSPLRDRALPATAAWRWN